MERIEKEGKLDEWCADNMKYFADLFGKENIIAAHLHMDEETPHILYYRDIQKLADSLKSEVVDLQQQKETAQEELKRAKKEVQTEKLKGAATTAATNIAESVGSLFGSNKVKVLERRNEDLQDHIFELEEESRQREQQQARQIQK